MLDQPVPLHVNNFTPLVRTPWAGTMIASRFKQAFVEMITEKRIGESWEFSCDPAFPSRVGSSDQTLMDLIESNPEAALGKNLGSRGTDGCRILVKLLNADQPLSLQIHPTDDDPSLKEGECGKPETWLVLDADPGAGIYLGFSRPIEKDVLRNLLEGDSLQVAKESLQFVPVKPGDYFEIDAGVPHAIGPGVCLLEPQRILFGQAGKTYRLWDWGRRYNDKGERDDSKGKPRELHLEAGLKLLDSKMQVGPEFVDSLRRSPTVSDANNHSWVTYPANAHYQVHVLKAGEFDYRVQLNSDDCYSAMIVLRGQARVGNTKFIGASSAFLSAKSFPVDISEFEAGTEIAFISPPGSGLGSSSS